MNKIYCPCCGKDKSPLRADGTKMFYPFPNNEWETYCADCRTEQKAIKTNKQLTIEKQQALLAILRQREYTRQYIAKNPDLQRERSRECMRRLRAKRKELIR